MFMTALVFGALSLSTAAASAQPGDHTAVLSEPRRIDRTTPVSVVPVDWRMDKLFIEASVEGEVREFIFDTGSPTMVSRALAETLGLEPIGRNVGVDANGEAVATDIAVVDTLTLGGVTFHDVPVLIFDFARLDTGRCLIDGGVIGSEILPASAWRIDVGAGALTIAEHADLLEPSSPSLEARLYDFGYPHMPIVDYAIGDVSDKALFDTGSADQVTLFQTVAENASVRREIQPGSRVAGRGSEGESAGGLGEFRALERFTLDSFAVGGTPLGAVRATTRGAPPTLLGAGLLHTHVVTLDYPGERFMLEPRAEPASPGPDAGYAIAFEGDEARVVQLYDRSPAARAGLRLGDRVRQVQGRPLTADTPQARCDAVTWLTQVFQPSEAAEIIVVRDGSPVRLHIPHAE